MSTRRRQLPASPMADFRLGVRTVSAPATSANLGPGFDALGLALSLHDSVEAEVISRGLTVQVEGEGVGVSRDESHLVVLSMRTTFDTLGVRQPALRLSCRNAIPHGRGLGSSAAAIVSGIRLAEALVEDARLTPAQALGLATELEGHPDNVAACLNGGLTIAWQGEGETEAVRLKVHPDVRPVAFIPPFAVSTKVARELLPAEVSHRAASENSARAALLVAALMERPDRLMAATEDRLHQEFRRRAMPASMALVDELRAEGIPAVISGAGPTVLALARHAHHEVTRRSTPVGWLRHCLSVAQQGAVVQ